MPQTNFAYSAASVDAAGMPLAVSVFADRAHLRDQMRDDAEAAGFRVVRAAGVESLLGGEARALGDVVLLDCPEVNGLALAALARLDLRAAHAGTGLVVSTSVAALDDVFACMDQSSPEILVEPNRADRVIALGRVLARFSGHRLRELGEEDRLMLLRLSEQVSRIADRLEQLAPATQPSGLDSAFRLEAPRKGFGGPEEEGGAPDSGDAKGEEAGRLARREGPALPDPRLLRRIIRQRNLRAQFFDGDLFADPAWDMLLDLAAARAEDKRVSVTSLCIASNVPPTTALRWISQLTDAGLVQRVEDESDRRRAFISLTDRAADAMARYFAELGSQAARLI